MKRNPLARRTPLRRVSATPASHREVDSREDATVYRARIAAEQGWRCANPGCRIARGPFEFDHVTPRSQGGSDHQQLMLCRACHQAKTESRLLVRPVIAEDGAQGYAWEDRRPRPNRAW